MPYKDPAKRARYHAAYQREWDKNPEHKARRVAYKWRYRKPWLRTCRFCDHPQSDRRWKCKNCGIAPRGPRKPRVSQAKAPIAPCTLCGQVTRLCWDHSHTTGKFRGWLCNLCNRGLGFFKDDPELVEKAARYLRATSLKATSVSGVSV